jgi:hypothetical protein
MVRRVLIAVAALAALVVSGSVPAGALAGEGCPNDALREEQGSTPLPDCRAYELVSPPEKNGGDVLPDAQRTRAAADGSALGFATLTGFGDEQGAGASTDYLSVRTGTVGTSGWSTHAITPPQAPLTFLAASRGFEPAYWGEFSDDLSRGVLRSWSPVTTDADVANAQNWYVRYDLRTPGPGSYQLLTACPGCNAPLSPAFSQTTYLAGASADFEHVIFESSYALTGDATPGGPNLYEWDHGTVRLAGILPDSACGSPPCAASQSQAGQGALVGQVQTPHTISADGSRIFFTVPEASCSGINGNDCGELYMRVDHATTVQLNVSEKTNGAGPGGTDENGPQPATYQDASVDGSRVFFTTLEALTNDAPVSGDRKLYQYSVVPDGQGHHLTFVSADHEPADGTSGDDVKGAMGVSADGETVYFTTSFGQLVAGETTTIVPGLDDKIYRWHDGTTSYVGELSSEGENENLNLNAGWGLNPRRARVTPDGRTLLFSSTNGAGFAPSYDHGSCPENGSVGNTCHELYVYRADAEPHVVCASCNPSGAPATADATDSFRTSTGDATTSTHLNHALSGDGRRVFFSTREALVPQDTNGKSDAYEYDVPSGTVHLLSTGKDSSDSFFMDASRNGDDAFVLTRQRLVGWDIDGSYDVYDVRVGGGLPQPSLSSCAGEACQGGLPAPPALVGVGSFSFAGAGNLGGSSLGKPTVGRSGSPQKLARALKSCRKMKKGRRRRCEAQARKRYGKKAATSGRSK